MSPGGDGLVVSDLQPRLRNGNSRKGVRDVSATGKLAYSEGD